MITLLPIAMFLGEMWKVKWRYYRDEYVRKKRALKTKSGQAAVRIKKWIYMDILGFLDTYTEEAEYVSNTEQSLSFIPFLFSQIKMPHMSLIK